MIETSDQLGNESQTSPESTQSNSPFDSSNQDMRDAIAELDKMDKFKFQGQEWTPKDLEKAVMRQKDYTQKTQSLAEERKQMESFKNESKFYENLYFDLQKVKSASEKGDNSLVNEFLQVYPEKFHSYLKEILGTTSQQPAQKQQSQPFDFETATRLQKVEKVIYDQEVAKNEAYISSTVDKMSKKYPDAIPEMAIARVYEAHNAGTKITEREWDKAFQQVDEQIKGVVKARYGDLVKKQQDANQRGRDVDSGGGTIGRAPEKFKSLGDVTKFAISDLTRKP